jgi:pre-mRNA-splicing helicase BRR2
MAEEFERSAKYEYRANSNLVLEANRDTKRSHEPSGEAESLYGRLGKTRMGDRVKTGRPAVDLAKASKAAAGAGKRSREEAGVGGAGGKEAGGGATRRVKRGADTVRRDQFLSTVDELASVEYVPKTKVTQDAWETLLSSITRLTGDLPTDVLNDIGVESIRILKASDKSDAHKNSQLVGLYGKPLAPEVFNSLVNLGKVMVDFQTEETEDDAEAAAAKAAGAGAAGGIMEDSVAVVFEDEDEEGGGGGIDAGDGLAYAGEVQVRLLLRPCSHDVILLLLCCRRMVARKAKAPKTSISTLMSWAKKPR